MNFVSIFTLKCIKLAINVLLSKMRQNKKKSLDTLQIICKHKCVRESGLSLTLVKICNLVQICLKEVTVVTDSAIRTQSSGKQK